MTDMKIRTSVKLSNRRVAKAALGVVTILGALTIGQGQAVARTAETNVDKVEIVDTIKPTELDPEQCNEWQMSVVCRTTTTTTPPAPSTTTPNGDGDWQMSVPNQAS